MPQADHLHVLLPGGMAALETLLPGFADGLRAAGAQPLSAPTDLLWLNATGWIERFAPRHALLSASRALIRPHKNEVMAVGSIR